MAAYQLPKIIGALVPYTLLLQEIHVGAVARKTGGGKDKQGNTKPAKTVPAKYGYMNTGASTFRLPDASQLRPAEVILLQAMFPFYRLWVGGIAVPITVGKRTIESWYSLPDPQGRVRQRNIMPREVLGAPKRFGKPAIPRMSVYSFDQYLTLRACMSACLTTLHGICRVDHDNTLMPTHGEFNNRGEFVAWREIYPFAALADAVEFAYLYLWRDSDSLDDDGLPRQRVWLRLMIRPSALRLPIHGNPLLLESWLKLSDAARAVLARGLEPGFDVVVDRSYPVQIYEYDQPEHPDPTDPGGVTDDDPADA